ncbi:MAG: cbb3-type cytochrome oxidase assembly protein CcoS [Parvibaculum sp.]|uniref:cbb3-type cytochrome oxidase assembly protein CcoS n=1 Tax=Parvibaculum sp. TaxID=2024848 RepID=UPI002ABB4C03|nr:cbb3-type cytochrome oxidase assembly protein CcoS [Parvibaculum sp.]MDZ4381331.1 cbb3-type cytochrome oxidase assembly protein CcoS [Parvibaculum sp.]
MNILIFLVPAALLLGLLGLVAFLWSLRAGQYDDLEGAAERILYDDDKPDADGPDNDGPDNDKPGDGGRRN